MITYSFRLFPNKSNIDDLNQLSIIRNKLWNNLIDIQNDEYKTNNKIYHNYYLDKLITNMRKESDISLLNSKACQRISKEVFSSYQSFFQLYKKDKSARPPRKIEDISKFHTIVFNQSGWSFINNDTIKINGVLIKYKSHLSNIKELNIKEIKIKFINNKWLCDILVEEKIEYKDIISQDNKVLAIDLGLKTLGSCIDNKGNYIKITNKSKKINKYFIKQISKVQIKLSKKQKDSKSYINLNNIKNKLYSKKNRQIKYTLHTQSKQLLSMNYHTIVIGKLTVKKLMEKDENKYNNISKSFHNSNINMFLKFLTQKAYKYNTNIIEINEHHTTQLNCLTNKHFNEKVELSDRTVKLREDIEIDRDLNASINILDRYFNNHLALMTEPLNKTNVIEMYNLNKSLNKKPISL